jgi:hypothetical protein
MIKATIVDRNINSLQSNLIANLKYIDFNYRFKDENSFVLRNQEALINGFKFWLLGEKHDFVRKPFHAGFCEGNLNRYKFSPDSEKQIMQELKTLTSQYFPQLEILDESKVVCDIKRKGWVFRLLLQDKITGMLADMRRNSLVIPAVNYPDL